MGGTTGQRALPIAGKDPLCSKRSEEGSAAYRRGHMVERRTTRRSMVVLGVRSLALPSAIGPSERFYGPSQLVGRITRGGRKGRGKVWGAGCGSVSGSPGRAETPWTRRDAAGRGSRAPEEEEGGYVGGFEDVER